MDKQLKITLIFMKRIHRYIREQIKVRIPNKSKLKPGQVIEVDSKKDSIMYEDEVKSIK